MAEIINSADTDGTNSNAMDVDETQKSFQDRLQDIPAYTMTLSSLSSWYTALKGTNEYIKSACDMGESIASAATPVIISATDAALKAAEPVVGDVKGTAACIDARAADMLGKVQEKIPMVTQTPEEMKASATDTANYYYAKAHDMSNEVVMTQIDNAIALSNTANNYYLKAQGFNVTQDAVLKQLDNAVSLSDLVVELCLPADSSDQAEITELEHDEQDENKGVLAHANSVKRKVYRRGTKKLMTYKAVVSGADVVQYAQDKISETKEMLMQGSTGEMVQYAKDKISETTGMLMQGSTGDMVQYAQNKISETTEMLKQGTTGDMVQHAQDKIAETTELLKQGSNYLTAPIQEKINGGRDLVSENWDVIYKTTMFIPTKTLQVTGKVFVSAKEMVFAFTDVHTITEIPRHVAEVTESYYNSLKEDGTIGDIKDKAAAFVYVPAQVVANYIQSNRLVQWIVPNHIRTDTIQVMENVNETTE